MCLVQHTSSSLIKLTAKKELQTPTLFYMTTTVTVLCSQAGHLQKPVFSSVKKLKSSHLSYSCHIEKTTIKLRCTPTLLISYNYLKKHQISTSFSLKISMLETTKQSVYLSSNSFLKTVSSRTNFNKCGASLLDATKISPKAETL